MNRRAGAVGAATAVALVATIAGLTLLGRGDLASPPFTSFDGFRRWLDVTEPAVALFAILRLAALAVAWYLLLLLLLGILATLTASRSAARAVAAAAPPGLRRAASALLGLGLVGVTGRLFDQGAGAAAAAPTEALVVLEHPPRSPNLKGTTEVLVPLDEEAGSASGEATLTLLPAVKARHVGGEIRAGPQVETWVVQPGDHLWSIAESHLSDILGRPPTDDEVAPYWRRVVEHNRSRLTDPRNPDLLFVDETIELPPPSGDGA